MSAAAWLVGRFVCSVGWGVEKATPVLSVSSWERWDSQDYLDIAAHGIQLERCTGGDRSLFHLTQCGTIGWLPGYSWLIRALHSFGVSYGLSGVLISGVAFYLAIYLIWFQWGRSLSSGRALILLTTFSLFPGCVYNFAVYPLSITLLLCTAAIVAAIRERFVLMAALLLAAGLCYPTAWLASLGLMAGVALCAWDRPREVIKRLSLASFGLLSILVLTFFEPAGHPFVYFTYQSKPTGFFGVAFFKYATTIKSGNPHCLFRCSGAGYATMLTLQAWIAILVTGLAVWVVMREWMSHRRDAGASSLYPTLAGTAVVGGLIFYSQGGAWYRSVLVAAPAVVVLRKLDIKWQGLILAVVAISAGIVSYGFFKGTLV